MEPVKRAMATNTPEAGRQADPLVAGEVRRFAVADIGSTAARFELAEWREGHLRQVLRDRAPLDLGRRVFGGGSGAGCGDIDPASEDALAALLSRWRTICERTAARARFLCTSAVREASNGTSLLAAMRERTGVQLEALSGEEEARLIARGALPHLPGGGPAAIIDVGGGSTEVIAARDGQVIGLRSLPLGSSRFQHAEDAWLTTVSDAVDQQLTSSVPRDFFDGARFALVTSGTARAVLKWAAPESRGCLTVTDFAQRVRALVGLSSPDRERQFADRAAKAIPAALILLRLCALGGLEMLIPCRHGLRRGALLELASAPVPLPPR